MAYTSDIPKATDRINDSQPQILANFTALVAWGNGYGNFTLQDAAPSGSTSTNQMYTLAYATTSTNELYVQKQAVDAPKQIPFTASKMSDTAVASCDNGWCYLPSGLLMKWGKKAISSGLYVPIDPTAESGGPNFTRAFHVNVTPYNTGSYVAAAAGTGNITNVTTGTFQAYLTAAATGVRYLVIGV